MSRLRIPSSVVSLMFNACTKGIRVRSTARILGKSHTTIIGWEPRLTSQISEWSPPAPKAAEVTIEGDEVYTRVGENLSPL